MSYMIYGTNSTICILDIPVYYMLYNVYYIQGHTHGEKQDSGRNKLDLDKFLKNPMKALLSDLK